MKNDKTKLPTNIHVYHIPRHLFLMTSSYLGVDDHHQKTRKIIVLELFRVIVKNSRDYLDGCTQKRMIIFIHLMVMY